VNKRLALALVSWLPADDPAGVGVDQNASVTPSSPAEVLAGYYQPDEHGRRKPERCTGR
jgi:hypothetical protein